MKKGQKHTDTAKQNMRKAHLGKKYSEATKQNMKFNSARFRYK